MFYLIKEYFINDFLDTGIINLEYIEDEDIWLYWFMTFRNYIIRFHIKVVQFFFRKVLDSYLLLVRKVLDLVPLTQKTFVVVTLWREFGDTFPGMV